MKSLYAKLLGWSLLTLLITGVGLAVVALISDPEGPPGGPGLGRGGGFGPFLGGRGPRGGGMRQIEVARRAWETQGAEGLRAHMEAIYAFSGLETVLADSSGKDLLTGKDYSSDITRLRLHRALPPLFPSEVDGRIVSGIPSRDSKYWLLVFRPAPAHRFPFTYGQIWVFVSAALLSFFLARSLTSPVRQLRNALERFGHGDFTARVNSKRGDEIGHLARSFDQMAERIQTLVQAERRLLVDISHELRSPLTRLGLAVELARTGEDRDAALDRIQREADRLNSLVGGLLQVTRGEADPAALARHPVRLDQLLAAVVDDCRYDAEARGCTIELTSPQVQVEGDPELLRRAVENVLRNAVRFSPASSKIEVGLEERDGQAHITIRDRGPGVPQDSLPHLFEAFYRVRDTAERHQDGFGLGLSIARRAVELHKGSIEAANAHPGLRVEMALPLQGAIAMST